MKLLEQFLILALVINGAAAVGHKCRKWADVFLFSGFVWAVITILLML